MRLRWVRCAEHEIDTEKEINDEGYDPDDPAVVAAIDRVAVAEVPTPAVAGSETVAVRYKRLAWRSATWAWL
jgi:hypothetical protein